MTTNLAVVKKILIQCFCKIAGTPTVKMPAKWSANKDEINFDFEGTGFVLRGNAQGENPAYVFNTELYIDNKKTQSIKLPVSFTTRRHELAWNYELPKGKDSVSLKILNPLAGQKINAGEVIVYSNQPVNGVKELEKASKEFPVK